MSKKRIVVNSFFLYAQTAVTVVISIFSSRYILEGMGIEDYGIYSVVGGIIGLMGFITATLSNSNSRFIANALGKQDFENTVSVFQSVEYITKRVVFFLLIALVIVGLIFINYVLNIPKERLVAANVVYACILVNTVYALLIAPYTAILFAREKIAFMSVLDIVSTILRLGIAYLITFTQTDNLILYAVLLMVLSFIHRTFLKVYCIKTDDVVKQALKRGKRINKTISKDILSFSGWNLLESLGIVTIRQGSILLVNLFFGVTVNAAYGIAAVVNMQMRQFAYAMLNAIKPVVYKSFGSESKERQEFFTFFTSKLGVILLSFVIVPVICEIDYILEIWLVEIPEYTAIFIKLALTLSLVSQMSYGLIISMQAYGRVKEIQIATFILQILNLPISYFLYKWGYPVYSIYIVTISIEILIFITRVFIVKKYLSLNIWRYSIDIFFKPALVVIATFLLFNYLTHYIPASIMRLALIFSSNIIIVGIYSYIFILNTYERSIFASLIQSLIKKSIKK